MEQLRNTLKVVDLIPSEAIGDTDGSAVDMMPSETFDSAMVIVSIGALTGTPTKVEVKIEEDDDNSFGSATEIEGGAEFEVEEDNMYVKEVTRTKQYIRAVVTLTGGTTPTAVTHIVAVLNNWSVPYNRV